MNCFSYFFLSCLCLISPLTTACLNAQNLKTEDKYMWKADSILRTLTLEEKIAQLIIIRASSNKDSQYVNNLLTEIEKYQVGGVCFFQGGITRQAIMTNAMQKVSKIPLFISIDAEWGLAMRLDSVSLFPRQMALGATYDTSTIYEMGAEIARQCKRLGIHGNFASCVDVNCNSNNPVINSRSFGADPHLVADCGIAYMKGLQDNKIMPFAKHFPGHGDTDSDSHFSLPVIKHNKKRLDSIELYPFQKAIDAGIDGIMVGHLNVPALDTTSHSISSSSIKIIKNLLVDSMHFQGIIITDGLEMKGIADYYSPGELEVRTLMAGNDLLLLPAHPQIVIDKVKEAIQQGLLTEEDINKKCLKVLKMKEKYVFPQNREIKIEHIYEDINSSNADSLYKQLTQESLTLLKNDNQLIPFTYIPQDTLFHFRIDNGTSTILKSVLSKYIPLKTIRVPETEIPQKICELDSSIILPAYVIVSLHTTTQYPANNYGLASNVISFLDTLSQRTKVIFILMGNPYVLNYIPFVERFSNILVAYHPVEIAEKAVAEALCYIHPITGRLPVSLNQFAYGTGIQTDQGDLTNNHFPVIDSIALSGIIQKAYPGCRILIGYDGQIIYNKAYGTHTYEDNIAVKEHDIYDLASVTKVAAATLAIMKLYDEDKLKLHDKLSKYLPYLKGSNKENINIAEVMTHTAGLKSWIPFYQNTIHSQKLDTNIYRCIATDNFTVKVCNNLYMNSSYIDSIYNYIITSPVKNDKSYEYSDLGFYLLADLIYKISGMTLDEYVNENFYVPMKLKHIGFNPATKFFMHQIPPTENDTIFRKQLIKGYVHDQGAAMLGGISGHAGLFSSAEDLYAIAEMLLNKGTYQNIKYLDENTVKHFTSYYSHNCRRGLGFDKPFHNKGGGPCSIYASQQSYGHSGFTGPFFWVDPKYDLIYIFLSNRVYPDANNSKITKLNIRTNIQDEIYRIISKKNEN